MGKKILVVEDERNIVDILTFNLQREGYDTLEALDGAAGLRLALDQDPDLILLDLMLPKMDGFQVCRTLRDQGRATPIIMLTAREEETDKVLGLELGADDYITKPFSMRELLARVKSNIRRTEMLAKANPQAAANRLELGRVQVDLDAMLVYKDGEGYDGEVQIQAGGVYSGTALRDTQSLKGFQDFTNQTEWSQYAKALNQEVDAQVIAPLALDESAAGKTATFVGAATASGGKIVITPVELTIE